MTPPRGQIRNPRLRYRLGCALDGWFHRTAAGSPVPAAVQPSRSHRPHRRRGEPEPSAYRPSPKSVSRLGRTYPSTAAVLSHMRAAGTIAPWNEFWEGYFAWRAGTGRRHRPDSDRLGCGERGCRLRIDARRDREGSEGYSPVEKAPGSYVRAT